MVPGAAPRFYYDKPLPRQAVAGESIALPENIWRHLQVLRLAVDDNIVLLDGLGGEFSAKIVAIAKRGAEVALLGFDPVERESPLQVTLVQGLATGDKMDLIVQKAVELGAAAIQPVSTDRATIKLTGDRAVKRVEHWHGVAIAACEQCGRNRVPVVGEIVALDAWLSAQEKSASHLLVMLHPDATQSLLAAAAGATSITVLIGPEGGFSEREIALAARHNVSNCLLGPRVLRTESAGLAALAALNGVYGDFR